MKLPKKYKAAEVEKRWADAWEEEGIYRFHPDAEGPVYSVDTPPPYVSSDHLHIGHAMSYTQAEIIIRFRRMRGFNVFYPMGFDDNGLPTERHVEKKYKVDKAKVSPADFIDLCLEESAVGEKTYEKLWRALGISCDWSTLYTTINPLCRRIAQRSFLDLHAKGRMYRENAPAMWCPLCTTSLAQADMEDLSERSFMNEIAFPLPGGGEGIISTTRPELLGACVALYVHPEDGRYKALVGRKAVVPLYEHEVPVHTSETVAMDVGTGLMMVCTFGDADDVAKWREDRLDMRVILNPDGRFNDLAGSLKGMTIPEGRKKIVSQLEVSGALRKTEPIEHVLNVHERCSTTVEFLPAPQWFIRLLDLKADLLKRGEEMNWFPAYMKTHFDHWVEGLRWDWCISRQRYYGVPFPVWYCDGCGETVLPSDGDLPVDPRMDAPPVDACPACGGQAFSGEKDVMDTWMTSSLTPLINARWGEPDDRTGRIYPMSLRPQAFEIIRTWLFYTTLKSHLHTDSVPFTDNMISGWGLDKTGKPFSKRAGSFVTSEEMVGKYSADGVRYWAAGAGLGQNLRFFEEDVKAGHKIVVKLWNVARFTLPLIEGYEGGAALTEVFDRWILTELREVTRAATDFFDGYEYSHTRTTVERFFWTRFCDNFLEIVKDRLYNHEKRGVEARGSGQEALRTALRVLLQLFAPIMPFVTEEIWRKAFPKEGSIHLSTWPDFETLPLDEEAREAGSAAVDVLSFARRFKTESKTSLRTPLKGLGVEAPDRVLEGLKPTLPDLCAAAVVDEVLLGQALDGGARYAWPAMEGAVTILGTE
ncbi:MAG: valine--tRNA ligase [Planctomycetota bacterium]|jgi:valyl-tRNA synthetase